MADTKITALTELTTVDSADLVAVVDDPSGTAVTKKATAANLVAGGSTYAKWDPEAPPSSPSAYDDEFDDDSFDTGLWTEFDPSSVLTLSEDAEGLVGSIAYDAGDDICGVFQDIPSGDFTITTKVSLRGLHLNYLSGGIALWQNAGSAPTTSDIQTFGITYEGTSLSLQCQYFQDYYNFMSNMKRVNDTSWPATSYFFRIRRDGTTYNFDYSLDGKGWIRFTAGALNFTPTEFGVFANSSQTTGPPSVVWQFFRYKNSDIGQQGKLEGQKVYV